jgi:hypothetical protein
VFACSFVARIRDLLPFCYPFRSIRRITVRDLFQSLPLCAGDWDFEHLTATGMAGIAFRESASRPLQTNLKGFCDSLSSLSAMEAIMAAKGISVKTYSRRSTLTHHETTGMTRGESSSRE